MSINRTSIHTVTPVSHKPLWDTGSALSDTRLLQPRWANDWVKFLNNKKDFCVT